MNTLANFVYKGFTCICKRFSDSRFSASADLFNGSDCTTMLIGSTVSDYSDIMRGEVDRIIKRGLDYEN